MMTTLHEMKLSEEMLVAANKAYDSDWCVSDSSVAGWSDEVARLEEELEEHDAYYRKVVNDECAPDEVHCTCVPALRDKIDQLEDTVAELLEALETIQAVGMGTPSHARMNRCYDIATKAIRKTKENDNETE